MPATKPTPGPDSAPADPADDTPKTNPAPARGAVSLDVTVPDGRLPAGVYEFTGSIPTLYLDVPLTAHPAYPEEPATDDTEAVPARPATVFDWPFGAPADGRWQPTKKKPNQVADNAPAATEE